MSPRLRFLSSAVVLLLVAACGDMDRRPDEGSQSDGGTIDGGSPDDRGLDAGSPDAGHGVGHGCQRNSDCETNLCLPSDAGTPFCTETCTSGSDCVSGWSCDAVSGSASQVCQCSPGTETCNGLDDDCDGVVDPATTDTQCAEQLGAGATCQSGQCVAAGCTTDGDCLVGSHCDLLTGQCVSEGAPTLRVCLVDAQTGAVDSSSCFPGAVEPPFIEFGDVAVGHSSVRTVRVFNDGAGSLRITDAHLQSSFSDFSLVGGTSQSPAISAHSSVDLQVRFAPTSTGDETADLVIPSNDTAQLSLVLPVHGSAQGPQLCLTPNPIEFGTVPTGESRTLQFTVMNCGNTEYDLTELALVNDDPTSTVFTLASEWFPVPLRMRPGDSLALDVKYKPIYIENPPAPGDSAYIAIRTDYNRGVVPVTGRGGYPGCDANGMNLNPTASIAVKVGTRVINPDTETIDPLSTVTFDGSSSSAPAPSSIIRYDWRIVSQPTGSVLSDTGTTAKFILHPQVLGDYTVELVAVSGDQCQSSPVTATVHVVSRAAVYVELTWPQAFGDVDLHYVGPGGQYYADTTPGLSDLDWQHSLATAYGTGTPQTTRRVLTDYWGLNNTCQPNATTSDDATFNLDHRQGYGPETVTHNRPFDGTYKVIVHAYCNGSGSTVSPAVRIYVNGALSWHGSQAGMQSSQVWEAANLVVSNNGTSINIVPLSTALWQDSHGCGAAN